MTALQVAGLNVRFGDTTVVRDVSLEVRAGEVLGIVGESGAGKSLLLRAMMGLQPRGAKVTSSALQVGGRDLRAASTRDWRAVRGAEIAFIGQDALLSLDPLRRIEREVTEAMEVHDTVPREQRDERVSALLSAVAIADPERRKRQYPHELSGGLRQRALIASALAADPHVLLADEPTTALDATVQRRVLGLLRGLADEGRAVILVTHDIRAVAEIADTIAVMRHGAVVETGPAAQLLSAPQHPYTTQLLHAATHERRAQRAADSDVILRAENISVRFRDGTFGVRDATVDVHRARVLGVVGESGSGKTTLARVLAGAVRPTTGAAFLDAQTWNPRTSTSPRRTKVALVAQSPAAALNPSWTIARTLREAASAAGIESRMRADAVARAMESVELAPELASRRPAQLSGGQLQRVVIARALLVEPDVLILDEALSALDVSIAAEILELLRTIQQRAGVAMVFVSHDLGVVAALADEIVVMQHGVIVEHGAVADVFRRPQHPFTIELLESANLDVRPHDGR